MQVACVEAVEDAAACRRERRGDLAFVEPVALKRPLIFLEFGRGSIELHVVLVKPSGGGKVLRSLVPDVGLRRLRVVGGCGLGSGGRYLGGGIGQWLVVGLFEQAANPLLRLVVVALAEVVVAR